MKIRWFIKTHTYTTWDDRMDAHVQHRCDSSPVLQFLDVNNGKWKEVPTVYQEGK